MAQGVRMVVMVLTGLGWGLLLVESLPDRLVRFSLSPTQSLLALCVAGVGSLALVTMRCQRPLDEVYEAAFKAGEQHERRRWLASVGTGERVVPLRRSRTS